MISLENVYTFPTEKKASHGVEVDGPDFVGTKVVSLKTKED